MEENLLMVKNNNDYWNFLNNKTKEYLSDTWFNAIDPFEHGFAKVGINFRGWNLIDTKGNFISNEWYDDFVIDKKGDLTNIIVKLYFRPRYLYAIMDTNGQLMTNWCNFITKFNDHGYSMICDDTKCGMAGGWNAIDRHGKYFSDKFFCDLNVFLAYFEDRLDTFISKKEILLPNDEDLYYNKEPYIVFR
jgi:hypothetical protein